MKLNNDGIKLILDLEQGYGAISYIRGVLLNIFNPNQHKEVNLLGITRSLDSEHYELFEDILYTAKTYDISVLNNIAYQLLTAQANLIKK